MTRLAGSRSRSDWALLLVLVGLWGTAFLFIKLTLESLPPMTLVASRVLIAACVLTVAVRLRGLRLPTSMRVWSVYLLMGIVGNALPFTLISWGQIRVDSGITGILMGVMPLVTLLLAHRFVPGERMTPRSALGFTVGFVGLVVLSGPEALLEIDSEASQLVPQAAILGGAVCYAVNTIIARRLATLDALVSSATVMWAATAIMLPIACLNDQPWTLTPSALAIGSAVWLGLGATAWATIVYFVLVQRAGPTFLSLMNYMIPVVALLAGVLVLDESLAGTALIGLALILAGLAISQLQARTE
ncbi:MAG: EamA family transporter [Myxococcota bacterium]